MIARALILLLLVLPALAAPAPPLQGKITGGFQAPSTVDPQGRRSVVKGTDATPQGNNVYLITDPKVTSFSPDDAPELFISSPSCRLDLSSNLAWSDSDLAMRTGDDRFSLKGTGWQWDPRSSFLIISNNVAATLEKSVLSTSLTSRPATGTNQPILITARRFQQDGDNASFIGDVHVQDGADTLRCARLNFTMTRPGGVQRIEAIQNVELTQGETRVLSGLALYELKQNTLTLSRQPRWFSAQREGSAETLLLNRSNNTLFAEGSVFMKLPLTNSISSGATNAPSTNRFVEIHAGRFQFQDGASNRLAQAIYQDKVRVVHTQGSILCEELHAAFDAQERLQSLVAQRNVEIVSDDNRAFGDTAQYDLATEKVTLSGNPRWTMDESTGSGDLVLFYPKSKELFALGHVRMTLPNRASGSLLESFSTPPTNAAPNAPFLTTITADTFSHGTNISVFHEGVRISDNRGSIECQLLTIVSGASNQVQRIIAQDDVRITQKDMVATGSRADYNLGSQLIHLTGDPALTGPDKSLRADAFIINRAAGTFSVAPGTFRIEIKRRLEQPVFNW